MSSRRNLRDRDGGPHTSARTPDLHLVIDQVMEHVRLRPDVPWEVALFVGGQPLAPEAVKGQERGEEATHGRAALLGVERVPGDRLAVAAHALEKRDLQIQVRLRTRRQAVRPREAPRRLTVSAMPLPTCQGEGEGSELAALRRFRLRATVWR